MVMENSKAPWAREIFSLKIIDNFGTRSQKVSPALTQSNSTAASNLLLSLWDSEDSHWVELM
jgi:hypothetical protein